MERYSPIYKTKSTEGDLNKARSIARPLLLLKVHDGKILAAVGDYTLSELVYTVEYSFAQFPDADGLGLLFEEEKWLSLSPEKILISLSGSLSLVPEEYASHPEFAIRNNAIVNLLPELNLEARLYTDVWLTDSLSQIFPEAVITTEYISLLQNKGIAGGAVIVNVAAYQMAVCVYSATSELRYFNTFTFNADTDFLYYCLLAAETAGIDKSVVPIVLWGDIEAYSRVVDLIKRFFADVRFGKPEKFTHGAGLKHIPQHRHCALLNLAS